MSLPEGPESDEVKQDVEEVDGSLAGTDDNDKIMHSILPVNKDIEEGNMINEALSKGLSSFKANLLYENLVNNFRSAKELYGETIIRQLTGYGADELERNLKIPEFQKEVKEKIKRSIKQLTQDNVLTMSGELTKESLRLAKLSMLVKLDEFRSKSVFGEATKDQKDIYGENDEIMIYRKGMPYKDIAVKSSVKVSLRRGHTKMTPADLRTFSKKAKKKTNIIYAIDASGSMKGKKLKVSKEAGVSLIYHALENKDEVGLVVFSKEVMAAEGLTDKFDVLVDKIVDIKASGKTDFVLALQKSHELLHNKNGNKHLVIITDALPTVGDEPEKESLSEIAKLKSEGISVSIIGIAVDAVGLEFGKRAIEISDGKFYVVKNVEDLSYIVLEDYYEFS
ncbi:VWA domain-containing protein [Candidatus Woesearchaeota archaeon]|nr:VWA domain-containing protein [Candidatus Woesearchaeota archaeon]